ncbi:MAG: hypothetical protein JSS07_11350 [Proteobacteria bacterium]|nr:hypothetical protein [Pseudomonadota bacterium]
MNTGCDMIISKTLLNQISGGIDPNSNPNQPYSSSTITAHGAITPNGVYDLGLQVMITPQVGIDTVITNTPNYYMGGFSVIYKW